MNFILAPLLSFLLLYKYYTLGIIMLVSAIIVPLPTNSMLLAAGAFASQGYFNIAVSMLVAIIANVIGDCIGYFLAFKYGRRALGMLHLKTPHYIERLEYYVKTYPASVIFVSRFFGTADSLANIFAGLSDVPFWKFIIFDVLGNSISTGGVIYIGYFLGVNWPQFSGFLSEGAWILLSFMVIIVAGVIFWHRRRKANRMKQVRHAGHEHHAEQETAEGQ